MEQNENTPVDIFEVGYQEGYRAAIRKIFRELSGMNKVLESGIVPQNYAMAFADELEDD